MESMTPEAGRRNNWTKVSTIPWYEWTECSLLPPACATEGGLRQITAVNGVAYDCFLVG